MFTIYTISYLLRTLLISLEGWMPKFFGWMQDNGIVTSGYFTSSVLYFLSIVIWDIFPIMFNLIMHYRNFKN